MLNTTVSLRQQLLVKFATDYQILLEQLYYDAETNDFVIIFNSSVSESDSTALLNYSAEIAGYSVEALEALVGKAPNWEKLVKALRGSTAWEYSYSQAKESLPVNASWTFLLIILTASKDLFLLRAALLDLRAELLKHSRDFNAVELVEITQALQLSDFDPNYLLT